MQTQQLQIQTPTQFANWGRTIISYPKIMVKPTTVDDLIVILKDTETFPTPVRPARPMVLHHKVYTLDECILSKQETLILPVISWLEEAL